MESKKHQPDPAAEQKAGQLFNRLAKILQGHRGDIAMTAAVNLAVFGAKGVGVSLEQLKATVEATWERTTPAERRG